MTMDKSLRTRAGMIRARNVLTRDERIQRLRAADRWQEGDSPFGLAKVRVYKLAVKKKKKKKKEEDGEGEAAEAAPAKTPAKTAAKTPAKTAAKAPAKEVTGGVVGVALASASVPRQSTGETPVPTSGPFGVHHARPPGIWSHGHRGRTARSARGQVPGLSADAAAAKSATGRAATIAAPHGHAAAGRVGPRPQQRLRGHQRRHPAGAQSTAPAAAVGRIEAARHPAAKRF